MIGLLLSMLFPMAAAAASSPLPDTPALQLERPVAGDRDYVDRLNQNAATLDAAVLDKRTGGTISGDLTVTGSIIGSGALLTGIPSAIAFITDNLISQVDGVDTTFTLSTAPLTGSLVVLTMDGLVQRQGLDFTLASNVITMATAPATNTYSFFVQYSTQTSGGAGGGGGLTATPPILGIGSIGSPLRLDTSSVTMLGPSIDASEAPLLASKLYADQIAASTGSLQAQIDNLSASATVFADTPILGNGGASNHLRLDSSSVTLLGPSVDSAEVSFNYAGSSSKGGAATTATALAANGTNCSGGQAAAGVDASGNAEGCTAFAPSSGLYNIVRSSSTAAFSTTSTSFVAITGSTATLTGVAASSRIRAQYSFGFNNGTNNQQNYIGLSVNGSVIETVCQITTPSAVHFMHCSGTSVSVPTAGGTVSGYLAARVDGGTLNLNATTGVRLTLEELK